MSRAIGEPFISPANEPGAAGTLRTSSFGVSPSGVRALGRSRLRICPIAGGTMAVGDTLFALFGRALEAINCPRPLFETMKVQ